MMRAAPLFELVAAGLDVGPMLAAVKLGMWGEITQRQTYPGTAHADTEAIYLRGPADLGDIHNGLESKAYPLAADAELSDAFAGLMASIPLAVAEYGRVMLVCLRPGGLVRPHSDQGAYAAHFSRFHVALQTNDGCAMRCSGENQHMAAGECWWFNHRAEHSAENRGDEPRVHLIFDARVAALYKPTGAHKWPSQQHM